MYRAAKRDRLEPQLIKAALALGATVRQLDDPGLPDLLIGIGGVNLLAEVKSPSGKLTAAQQQFFDLWKGQVYIVRSAADIERLIARITSKVVFTGEAFPPALRILSGAWQIR